MASLVRSPMRQNRHSLALTKRGHAFRSINTSAAFNLSTTRRSHSAHPPTAAALSPLRVSKICQIVTFHSSAAQLILPPLPQTIEGTANDPAPIPEASPTHGSYHWTFERLLAAGLVPLTIAPFAIGSLNPVLDAVLCGTIIVHSHVGFQACIIDYFPTKRVPKTRAALWWALRGATILVGVGLYEFETTDVGVTEAIKKVWTS